MSKQPTFTIAPKVVTSEYFQAVHELWKLDTTTVVVIAITYWTMDEIIGFHSYLFARDRAAGDQFNQLMEDHNY